jgi:predicted RNA polymerase sigma factor
MKYTILVYENESDFSARTDGARKDAYWDAYWGAYKAYTQALTEAGVMAGGAALQPPIALLYEGLIRLAPTIGGRVGHAAALAEARDAEAGLEALGAIPPDAIDAYQPYWALNAHLLKRLGRHAEAEAAYARAIGLCEEPAVRRFLAGQSPPVP